MVVPWLNSVAPPVARLAFALHATLAAGAGQQGLSVEFTAETPAIGKIKIKWRLLLPGASEPRLTELNPSGL